VPDYWHGESIAADMIQIPSKHPIPGFGFIVLMGFLLSLPGAARAFGPGDSSDITAVCGRTSTDYVRSRQADGSFTPESYAFGEGGNWAGDKKDFSIDKMTFLDVAHVIAPPLAEKNYIPTRDSKSTKLLIMVYWGTTHAPENASGSDAYLRLSNASNGLHPPIPPSSQGHHINFGVPASPAELAAIAAVEAENRIRDKDDALIASMLGYDSWWLATANYRDTPLDVFRKEMLEELESDRYFVVLMAYDFQLIWKQKKHKLLWETRFSIRERGHNFNEDLVTMAQSASKYFGQDSQGLVRTTVPFAHVDIGELKSLGEVDGDKK
jgi:hypothetical protein